MYLTLAILGGFALLYSLFATRIEKTWITGPIVFVAFGFAIGPSGLGLLSLEGDSELLSVMAELTLALLEFPASAQQEAAAETVTCVETDPAAGDFDLARRQVRIPEEHILGHAAVIQIDIVRIPVVHAVLVWDHGVVQGVNR